MSTNEQLVQRAEAAAQEAAAIKEEVEELVGRVENIQIPAIQEATEDIRQAINNKGVNVPEGTPLAEYAGKIMSISTGGGGGSSSDSTISTDIYLCHTVYGPVVTEYVVVTNAGEEDCNGRYEATGAIKNNKPMYSYKSSSGRTWYIYFISDEWEGDSWVLTDNTSTSYPYGAYYYATSLADEWYTGESTDTEAPQVSKETVLVNADQEREWEGYKVIPRSSGGYEVDYESSRLLTYHEGFRPVVGMLYDTSATVKVCNLFGISDPIDGNDASCLIYIDSTSLTNKAAASNKHAVTFGSGVSIQDGYIHITNDSSGQILTTAKSDGFGGALTQWTWDFVFMSDASMLDCSGHSVYGWTIEARPDGNIYFRGQNVEGKNLMVKYYKNEYVCISMQYDNGVLHIWDKGKYIGTCNPSFSNCDGKSFGIGCIADGDYDRMADKLKFFRFSNKLRYLPNFDIPLPDDFLI